MHRFLLCVVLSVFTGSALTAAPDAAVVSAEAPAKKAEASVERVALKRGEVEVRFLAPANAAPRAIVIFGSGDGGWSYWEERVAQHLGGTCAVVGVDFSKYADKDYDQATLVADYAALVAFAKARVVLAKPDDVPVIFGGWSMGAEQAVAAVEVMRSHPVRLAGLLLVAPGPRGRYGLRLSDRAGLAPRGEGTFGLVDFAATLKSIKLAQFHARYDLLDTPGWADGLGLNLRRFDLPRGFHDFEGAGPDFLNLMDDAMTWIVSSDAVIPEAVK
ncbi:hypothetical protein CMV30_17795 [Nibricoccus aquaticus]|uniref:Bacterial virulence domain-containing protein n=1 Tax=Nibricoccus aquaticus TaxID=2576891 RepID=A0A290QJY1_9BACT|nr:AcvB/VirJ family lysyl-phosphatidylglycerol hydrolase [Nibricoccus aquaticus]ATC65648.1 hypothetical protein CMV30_17795 [Nibricoccus aquaticus]